MQPNMATNTLLSNRSFFKQMTQSQMTQSQMTGQQM